MTAKSGDGVRVAYRPSIQEAETGGQPELHSKALPQEHPILHSSADWGLLFTKQIQAEI